MTTRTSFIFYVLMGFFAFLLSIAVDTMWLDGKISLLISCGLWIFLSIIAFFFKKGWKSFLMIFLGVFLAFGVVQVHLWMRGEGSIINPAENAGDADQGFVVNDQGGSVAKRQTFNGFVQVVDTQKRHTYLVEDEEGNLWRLSSNQGYHLGDQLFLSASLLERDDEKVFGIGELQPWTSAFWQYQFNYDKWLFMKKIDGTMYEKTSLLLENDGGTGEYAETMMGQRPLQVKLGFIDHLRARLQKLIESVYGNNAYAGLLLGLLIGDKSLLPAELYDSFVASGTVHIIAVSGGNIAMVVILLNFLLGWIPVKIRNGLIIVMISCYALLCGGDSSVVRAAIMGGLTLVALFRGREISIWRLMKYALVGILLFNPFALVYDVGLLLSFGAIIGIVLVGKWDEKRVLELQKLNKKEQKTASGFFTSLKMTVLATVGASLGTAPVLLFFMNGVNLVGIVLNFLIVPLVPIVTVIGMISLVLYAVFPFSFWLLPEKLLMSLIFGFAEVGETWSISLVAQGQVEQYLLVALFVSLGVWGYWKLVKHTG